MSTDQNNTNATTPGWYYGWIIVAVAFVTQAVTMGGIIYSYSVIAVILNDEFAVSRLQLMLPMTLMTLMGVFYAPVIGAKLDKYPVRYFMMAGTFLLMTGLLLLSMVSAFYHVILVYAFLLAPVNVLLGSLCCSVLISRWFSSKLALAMGIAAIGVSIGGFLIPPLIEWLNQQYGWRDSMRLLSLAVVVLIGPLTLLIYDKPQQKGLFADGAKLAPDTTAMPAGAEFDSTKAVLRNKSFWLLAISMGVLFSSYSAIISNLLPLVVLQDVAREDGVLLISIMAATGIAGKLVFGAVADRIDMRVALAAAVILLMSGIGLFIVGSNYSQFVVASVVMGLSAGGLSLIRGAMIALLFGVANFGRVMGMMNPVIISFNLMAVPFTGYLFDKTGSYTMPFTVFVVCLALSLLWIPAIKRAA